MREILPPMGAVQKLCAAVRPQAGPYRPSLYGLSVPCAEGTLLYHTLTGELLLLSPEEAAGREDALRQELIRRRFLVMEGVDEPAYARQVHRIAAQLEKREHHITSFTVFTTTDCNARCPYCYERGRPRRSMSDEVARDAAAYVARASGGRAVKLTWFGGEPLCNANAMDILSKELRARGVSFRSAMVSNGYLFDEATVRKAREAWAMDWAQITLDGRAKVYDRVKGFAPSEGSAYERVIANMERLLSAGMALAIRLNAESANLDELSLLADELLHRFRGQRQLMIYSVLLRDFAGNRVTAQEEALKGWDALQRKLIASGMGGTRPLPRALRMNGCMADSDSSVTILPDGRLGKCEHESERLLVGNIYDGVTDGEMLDRWKERVKVPACRACPLAPACNRLRMCAWTGGECTEADRARIRLSLAQSVLNEYRRYRDRGGKLNETETNVDFPAFGR